MDCSKICDRKAEIVSIWVAVENLEHRSALQASKKHERDASVAPFSGNAASKVKSAVPLNVHTSGASTHEVDLPLSCNRSHTLTRSHYQPGSCSRSPLTERACPQSPVLARHREESLRDSARTAGFLLGSELSGYLGSPDPELRD